MDLAEALRSRLAPHADPERARAQQAYLKTTLPMMGLTRPTQGSVFRAFLKEHPPADRAAWEAGARALWAGPERDLKYAAVEWVKGFRGRYLDLQAIPLIEAMIREGAWWDLVDDLAANAVGPIVLAHREAMRPVLDRWIADPDLWIRRTAILAQLKHREATDLEQLFAFCLRQADDRTFWIRKAIGWALRQHARTNPAAIRAFLALHGARFSGLTRREASKHL